MEKWLSAYKTHSISQTVKMEGTLINCLYKVIHKVSIGPKMDDLE